MHLRFFRENVSRAAVFEGELRPTHASQNIFSDTFMEMHVLYIRIILRVTKFQTKLFIEKKACLMPWQSYDEVSAMHYGSG